MFGHWKAQEFMNELEGASLSADRRKHLDACPACAEKLQSLRMMHSFVAAENTDIPEPEWDAFRSSVRDGLLSRSVQRESAVRRWTGWPIRPAMAWGLSLALLITVSAGGFLWHVSNDAVRQPASPVNLSPTVVAVEAADMEAELAAWAQGEVFEDLAAIQGPQAEQIRKLLQEAQ